MWITQTYAKPSRAESSGGAMSFQMAGEAHRPAVKLHATILESAAYARAMLALFEVVKSDGRFKAKDHTAYQEWVRAEYLKELAPQLEAKRRALPGQIHRRDELSEQITALQREAAPHQKPLTSNELWEAKRRYWKWLYSRDHALWIILDPVVSVHPDAVIFEVFSQDESSYGRVTVKAQNLQTEGETVYGTTNVDFSEALANEIQRVRPYRPAKLGVEGGGVSLSTDAGSRVEKKIDLPPSWVRGFLQVQSAATLPGVNVTLSSALVADLLDALRRQREKNSPRSLKFILTDGEMPKVIIEPWGIELKEREHVYRGQTQEIRIWGRRRLMALEGLLPHAETVEVRLLGTGMPSFWSSESKGHRFDIGLSGWTKNDWSSAARFDLLASTAPVTAGDIELARGQLENALRLSPDELASRSDLSREAATAALQQLCKDGDAMFDAVEGFYRWRKLLPPGVEAAFGPRDPRLEYAKRIVAAGGVKWQKPQEDDFRKDESGETTRLNAQVSGINDAGSSRNERKFDVTLDVNPDGRVSFAQCSCSEFRRDKLKKGPCAHILATAALASSQVAGARAARAAGETKSGGIDPTRFAGLSFCFTGALSIYSRDQAESLVEQSGGKAASGVSRGLTYLVAGERAGSKLMKAKLLGVKVISEADFKSCWKAKPFKGFGIIMSEEQNVPTDWRARIKEQGKEAFQLEELRRLGFWPPAEGLREQVARAEEEIKRLDRLMAPLRQELRQIEGDIAKAQDVQSALDQIRHQRIERVKAAREAKQIAKAIESADRATHWKERRATTPQFLGRGVSEALQFPAGDGSKLRANGLPFLETSPEIAAAIGIEARELTWLCYHRGASFVDHYHRFQISKKKGGMRNVSAPKTKLRRAQSWLLEQILTPLPVHTAAMAFRPGVSTGKNAALHAGKAVVVRLDLKDFFPSIGFIRVRKLFRSFGYNDGCATIFALLCTEAPRVELTLDGQKRHVAVGDRVLPQGACTSPALTNVLCRRLDARLTSLAAKRGFVYTRYADDLVFSSDDARADVGALIHLTKSVVTDEKFVLNEEKTLVMKKQNRQAVTGLVVNAQSANGPRVSREDLRKFRAFLHQFETQGREAMTQKLGQDALAYARGYLAYIHMSDPARAGKLRALHSFLTRSVFEG